jgi:isopentenyl-diphosphate delta-isomerase type 1
MSELLDLVDKRGDKIGTATREECHNNPKLIHSVVHCWILNSKKQILWQQRSMTKDVCPGYWDMSCGGHVPSGEKPDTTIIRELNEELGVKNEKPIFVEKYLWASSDKRQTELIYLYYLIIDESKSFFKLEDGEVEQVKWFDIEDAKEKYKSGEYQATGTVMVQIPKIIKHLNKF